VVLATGGSFGYWRGLAAGSLPFGAGSLTAAAETVFYNGLLAGARQAAQVQRLPALQRGTPANGLSITALGYTNSWHSTDQIPVRAVSDGGLDRFGAVDQTDGGDTQRYSLSMNCGRATPQRIEGRGLCDLFDTQPLQQLHLFPRRSDNGDQFQQSDKRKVLGLNASHLLRHGWRASRRRPRSARKSATTTSGRAVQHLPAHAALDRALRPGERVEHRNLRQHHDAVDRLDAGNAWRARRSVHGVGRQRQFCQFRLHLGVPGQPQARVVFGPFDKTEFYINAGLGYHSNDRAARPSRQSQAPEQGRSRPCRCWCVQGAEIGVRTQAFSGLDASLALFLLDFDSELLSSAMPATTEPSRPSQRIGVEVTSTWRPRPWASVDHRPCLHAGALYRLFDRGDQIPGRRLFIASGRGHARRRHRLVRRVALAQPRPPAADLRGSVYSSFTTTLTPASATSSTRASSSTSMPSTS